MPREHDLPDASLILPETTRRERKSSKRAAEDLSSNSIPSEGQGPQKKARNGKKGTKSNPPPSPTGTRNRSVTIEDVDDEDALPQRPSTSATSKPKASSKANPGTKKHHHHRPSSPPPTRTRNGSMTVEDIEEDDTPPRHSTTSKTNTSARANNKDDSMESPSDTENDDEELGE